MWQRSARATLIFTLLWGWFSGTAAHAAWFDSGSDLSNWQNVYDAQFADPQAKCLAPAGSSVWQRAGHELTASLAQSPPCKSVIQPKIAQPFSKGVLMSYDWFVDTPNSDRNIMLIWHDPENQLSLHTIGSVVNVEKWVAGQNYAVANSMAYFPLQPDTWHHIEVRYHNGQITAWLDGVVRLQASEGANDPKVPAGLPGLGISTGQIAFSNTRYRNIRITEALSEQALNVELLKQNDPRWSSLEYDTATRWSSESPTLARWGCALTSAVMVLRFYGHTSLPDGSPLLPDTLNTWLLQQADGYIGDGLVNWRAISRLSAQLDASTGNPTLSFAFSQPETGEKLRWLREQLAHEQPVILDQGEHFVVATGYGEAESDVSIHDPLYSHTSLQPYNSTYDSARIFSPTHTDLRALVVVSPVTVQTTFTMSHPNDQVVRWLEQTPGSLESQPWLWQEITAPESDSLQVALRTTRAGWYPVYVFAYGRHETFEVFSGSRWLSTEPLVITTHGWQAESPEMVIAASPAVDATPTEELQDRFSTLSPLIRTRLTEWAEHATSLTEAVTVLKRWEDLGRITAQQRSQLTHWTEASWLQNTP